MEKKGIKEGMEEIEEISCIRGMGYGVYRVYKGNKGMGEVELLQLRISNFPRLFLNFRNLLIIM